MKLPVTIFILIFSFISFYSCNNKEEKKEGIENTAEKKANDQTKKVTKKTAVNTTEEVLDEEEQTKRFTSFINSEMDGFKLVPETLWLQPEFITDINTAADIDKTISYNKSVSVKGDFNGDGFTDHAAFILDKDNRVYLMSFHQTENGYDKFILSEETNLTECCLARGMAITPPGIYFEKDTKKEIIFKTDGIIYNFYGNSNSMWYYNGQKYVNFPIDD